MVLLTDWLLDEFHICVLHIALMYCRFFQYNKLLYSDITSYQTEMFSNFQKIILYVIHTLVVMKLYVGCIIY